MGIRREQWFAVDEMLTYFTSFRLFTHIEVNNIRATIVLNKNRLRKCTLTWVKQLQKRNGASLNSAFQAKKAVQCNFDSGWFWNDNMAVYIVSSESSKPKRFVRRWKKVKRTYILLEPEQKFLL